MKLQEATLKLEDFVSASSFVKTRHKIAVFAVGFTLLLCAAGVSAQETPKPIDAPVMFDEYGRIGGCDHSARLDNLAVSLQNDPNLQSYLVYYGPESVSKHTLGIITDYLVNTRGLAEDRVKTIYAGPNSDPSEPRIQLWLAPPGAPVPELTRYEDNLDSLSGLFDEYRAWDGVYSDGDEVGELTGPPIPAVASATFAYMLNTRKDTVAYLVAFTGTHAAPGAWRRLAQREAERLQSNGVAADRVRIIYGGVDKGSEETKIQRWILPADAPPPMVDAGPEPPPATTIEVGTYGDYGYGGLGDAAFERGAFKIVLGALRENRDVRVCIIVRVQQAEESPDLADLAEPEEAAREEAPATEGEIGGEEDVPESQPADLIQLVEKWRTELTIKHNIPQERLVVLFAPIREGAGNSLETWIVPPGALLPDSNAESTEETTEEAAEEAKPAEPVGTESDKSGVPGAAGKPGR